jgi:L-alanine-DL-glutamate epimerase-like enolase superfamily enzyme
VSTTEIASDLRVEQLHVSTREIPVDGPGGKESDGTLEWSSTTVVFVEVSARGETGLGWTYGPNAVATLIEDQLADVVRGSDPLAVRATWEEMGRQLRNAGRPGIGSMAVAAVDTALWDLRARLLGVSLVDAIGRCRDSVPVYGSGGFCNYPLARLREQLGGWVADGFSRVKLKVGRNPEDDPLRLAAAREEIGDEPELFVDANGAFSPQEGLAWAERYARDCGVTWFEEPVSSADFDGLRFIREHGPAGLEVAAGEYAYVLRDALNLLEARAVDCLQLDVTRCGGITGFLQADALCVAHARPLSAHCAPALAVHGMAAAQRGRHIEYFHDHVRIEGMLFDGVPAPDGGELRPDPDAPGHGLTFKRADAERFRA